ncbi:MAG: hypothetical protein PHG82_00630 [Candidatus Gracilibacteria bacterium]|nr:hypothetical protein [Candidatus Gracilibacteria bacterium]
MKKLLLLLVLLFSFNGAFISYGDYDESSDVSTNLNNFAPDTLVGTNVDKYTVETGFKTQISTIVKNISIALSLIAVGALVFAGLKMTLSQGKDEDLKKAKDIIKWTLIGYLGMISAGAIIAIVINFIYGLG